MLHAGAPGAQLTWMDAKIGDWVVTPRSGKPVEIQALWYNALRIMEDLAARFSDDDRRKKYSSLAALASLTFNRIFWNEDARCLYDVVNGGPPDAIYPPKPDLRRQPASLHAFRRARAGRSGEIGEGTADAGRLTHAQLVPTIDIVQPMKVTSTAAIPPIIRGRCGRGCWGLLYLLMCG